MTFHVGQKVVCVNAGAVPGFPLTTYGWGKGEALQEGLVYTIHSTLTTPGGVPAVRLCEIKRAAQAMELWGHDGYWATRFRPIVERKADISIFTSMLNPSKRSVDA